MIDEEIINVYDIITKYKQAKETIKELEQKIEKRNNNSARLFGEIESYIKNIKKEYTEQIDKLDNENRELKGEEPKRRRGRPRNLKIIVEQN
jgi:Skp family chaperone for outer membrane proteins